MKLHHLRNFITAAELGSLRAAARKLHLAQPAITRSIREMERELGAPLFERHQQGVRLTASGELFLRRAQTIQSELRRAHDEIRQIDGEMTGEISIAMSAVASFALQGKTVQKFRARYPKAAVKITEGFFRAVEAPLLTGQVDFYVGPFGESDLSSRFLVEKLFDHRWVVIARKGHPAARKKSLAALCDEEWVKPALTERSAEADIIRPFEARKLSPPKIVLQTTSAITTLIAVATSDLLAIIPKLMLRDPISTRLFEVLKIDEVLEGAPICMVRRIEMPLTPLAEYFADLVRRAAMNLRDD